MGNARVTHSRGDLSSLHKLGLWLLLSDMGAAADAVKLALMPKFIVVIFPPLPYRRTKPRNRNDVCIAKICTWGGIVTSGFGKGRSANTREVSRLLPTQMPTPTKKSFPEFSSRSLHSILAARASLQQIAYNRIWVVHSGV